MKPVDYPHYTMTIGPVGGELKNKMQNNARREPKYPIPNDVILSEISPKYPIFVHQCCDGGFRTGSRTFAAACGRVAPTIREHVQARARDEHGRQGRRPHGQHGRVEAHGMAGCAVPPQPEAGSYVRHRLGRAHSPALRISGRVQGACAAARPAAGRRRLPS